jgi:WD40 repeat protein
LATAHRDKTVRLWNVADGKEILVLDRRAEGIQERDWFRSIAGIAFSPDGQVIAVFSWDGVIHLRETTTGKTLHRLDARSEKYGGWQTAIVAFAPDGRSLAGWGKGNAVRFWDTATGNETPAPAGHSSRIRTITFAPSGGTVATGGADGTIRLWEARTGKETQRLEATVDSDEVRAVAFAPDGNMVAAMGSWQLFRTWETATDGKAVRLYPNGKEHKAETYNNTLAFAPAGGPLAVAGHQGNTAKCLSLWDYRKGVKVRELEVMCSGCVPFLRTERSWRQAVSAGRSAAEKGEAASMKSMASACGIRPRANESANYPFRRT